MNQNMIHSFRPLPPVVLQVSLSSQNRFPPNTFSKMPMQRRFKSHTGGPKPGLLSIPQATETSDSRSLKTRSTQPMFAEVYPPSASSNSNPRVAELQAILRDAYLMRQMTIGEALKLILILKRYLKEDCDNATPAWNSNGHANLENIIWKIQMHVGKQALKLVSRVSFGLFVFAVFSVGVPSEH